jgi:hypothetical protein
MKQLATSLFLLSTLCCCTAKLATTSKPSAESVHTVTRYCLPKKLMQVTATYTIQQQQRYALLKTKPKKGSKYQKKSFANCVVTVDGALNVKYWLEDDTITYYLTANRKRGFTSTDLEYVPGTHILKALNSSLTPQGNQVAVATIKFAAAVASTVISGAVPDGIVGETAAKAKAAKTDSVVVESSKTIPLTKIINLAHGQLKNAQHRLLLVKFDYDFLRNAQLVSPETEVPTVEMVLTRSLDVQPGATISAAGLAKASAEPDTDGIFYRAPFYCTVETTIRAREIGGQETIQSNVSRVSFPQLGAVEVAKVDFRTGLTDGKQSVSLTLDPENGGLLKFACSRENQDPSAVLNQVSAAVQNGVDAYEKRAQQQSELQQLKESNEILEARLKQRALQEQAAGAAPR